MRAAKHLVHSPVAVENPTDRGTLSFRRARAGVVTAVAVQCAPRPASIQLAFLAVPSFAAVRSVLSLAKRRLGEVLSACEFLDAASMAMAVEFLPGAADPLRPRQGQQQQEQQQGGTDSRAGSGGGCDGADSGTGQPPFYMLIETHGSDAAHDAKKLERFLEAAMAEGLVGDGTIAGSDAQAASIWRVREGVTEALTRRGEGGWAREGGKRVMPLHCLAYFLPLGTFG